MMLYSADDDLITLLDIRLSVDLHLADGESQSIDAIRRSFGKNDLFCTLGAYEIRYCLPSFFMVSGSYLTQMMHPAVDIAVPMGIRLGDGIYHCLRFLACSRIIEID